MFVGRNSVGFGKLQNCDSLHLQNFGQTSATMRFNVETRCMRTDDAPVAVRARLESASPIRPLAVDDGATVNMQPGPDGYAQQLQQGVQLPVNGGGPYFDLEGAEANLTVTVTDFDGDVGDAVAPCGVDLSSGARPSGNPVSQHLWIARPCRGWHKGASPVSTPEPVTRCCPAPRLETPFPRRSE